MWMADPHIISALREKRALVSGLIEKLERKLEQHRADLTHIDVCCGYSSPTATLAKSSPSELMSGGLATSRAMSCRGSVWTRSERRAAHC